jgi:hypothetical protein
MGLFGIRDIDLPAIVPHSSLLLGSLLCISGILLFHYFVPNVDPHEPPIIRQRIPYFGHVVGLLRYGLGYFDVIRLDEPQLKAIVKTHLLIPKVLANRIQYSRSRYWVRRRMWPLLLNSYVRFNGTQRQSHLTRQ